MNPFVHSRENAERSLLKHVAAAADEVNMLLAAGIRSINFPPGLADGAVQVLNKAGGWSASVLERTEEAARIVVKRDVTALREGDCPFFSYDQARAQSLEHIGKAANLINEQFSKGARTFVQPIGIVDDLVDLLNEPCTRLKATITHRDEDNQMAGRFVICEVD